MDVSYLLDSLNDKQREAVSATPGHYLILAGAGSGKTRVLVHRIAWLLQVEQVSPHAILAVTFTNKAAGEMRHRIENMLGFPTRGLWVGTFHGLAHRLLRAHWQAANLPENFQILDSDDQFRLIKRILKAMDLDEDKWQPRQVQWFINSNKDEGLRPQHLSAKGKNHTKVMIKIYEAYEQQCQQAGLVDFAEILLRSHELWLKQPDILKHYQTRFSHILVDEFQDTNAIQYAWLKMLAGDQAYMMAVGDDDQSIYGWRGARIENIHRFSDDFKQVQTIRLEQNYRSTATILQAANALISQNDDRLGKELWTEGQQGELIDLYAAFNELDEARYVVQQIQKHLDGGGSASDIAILYRSNAQSRVIEENLIRLGIPYRVYGGLRFFERAEIKDALAYCRLLLNRRDDAALERIINLPTRGIGEKTLDQVRQIARTEGIPLWFAAVTIVKEKALSSRAHNALVAFMEMVDALEQQLENLTLEEKVEQVLADTGLLAHYQQMKGEKAQSKVENLKELVQAAKNYTPDDDDDLAEFPSFISHAALESGENQADKFTDCVQLMTLHTAKGLEFPLVYMVGVEEGLFPHKMALNEGDRLEEERRLCYVGMTRAMEKLTISYAELRRQFGSEEYHRPSRFIAEIPREYLQEVRVSQSRQAPSQPVDIDYGDDSQSFYVGQMVTHPSFGEGMITNYEGRGNNARVQVKFMQHGSKWLVLGYANLTPA